MHLEVEGAVAPERVAELTAYVRDQRLTEHLVRDALDAGLRIDDVVQQDEFTLDLLVALPDGLWLVYDTT